MLHLNRCLSLVATVISFIVFLPEASHAQSDIEREMEAFYNNLSATSNITDPRAYGNLAEGGYISGGSLALRFPQTNLRPIRAELPSINAGCNGIDIHGGALSFAGVDEYINLLRNIAQNSTGYAFQLALEAISPTIADTVSEVQDTINKINALNINSCQAAKALVDGAVEFHQSNLTEACIKKKMEGGSIDRNDAQIQCQTETAQTVNSLSDTEQESLLVGNIVWKALMGTDLLAADPDRAELVMTYTGTVIYPLPSNDSAPLIPAVLPGLVLDDALINIFLEGGQVFKLSCDTITDCENVTTEVSTLTDGLLDEVRVAIGDMYMSAKYGSALTDDALRVMGATTLPLYRYINVLSAYSPLADTIPETALAEYVAVDIFFAQLDQMYTLGLQSLQAKRSIPEKERRFFIDAVQRNRETLYQKRQAVDAKMIQTQQLITQLDAIERRLSTRVKPDFLNQAGFSGGNAGNF